MISDKFRNFFSGFVGKVTSEYLPDLMFVGGIGAVVWGIHMYSVPIAWMAGGTASVVVALGLRK